MKLRKAILPPSNSADSTPETARIPTLNIGEWGILAGVSEADLKSINTVAEAWAKIAVALAEDRGLLE